MKGGRRENSGRKKGGRNKSNLEIREILDRVVDFDKVIDKLQQLSQGVTCVKLIEGVETPYEKPPDSFASKILLEYRFGKPLQEIKQETTIKTTQKFKIGNQEIDFD